MPGAVLGDARTVMAALEGVSVWSRSCATSLGIGGFPGSASVQSAYACEANGAIRGEPTPLLV